MKVLIIFGTDEMKNSLARMCASFITKKGHTVEIVSSLEQAVTKLKNDTEIDTVITEINLGNGKFGLSLVNIIHNMYTRSGREIKTILCYTSITQQEKRVAGICGAEIVEKSKLAKYINDYFGHPAGLCPV